MFALKGRILSYKRDSRAFLSVSDFNLHWYLVLSLPLGPSSVPCRLGVSCRRKRVGLKVKSLLQDPREKELGGDNGERCRHGGATQSPVLLAGNHYSLSLEGGGRREMERQHRRRNWGALSSVSTLRDEGIFGRKTAPLQQRISFMWTGSGFTDFVTWIWYPWKKHRRKAIRWTSS